MSSLRGEEGGNCIKGHDICISIDGDPIFETSKVSNTNNDKVQALMRSNSSFLHKYFFNCFRWFIHKDTYIIPSHAQSVPPVVLLALAHPLPSSFLTVTNTTLTTDLKYFGK